MAPSKSALNLTICLFNTVIIITAIIIIYIQGCRSWGGDVAGTAVSRTRVAMQSRGPGNTHHNNNNNNNTVLLLLLLLIIVIIINNNQNIVSLTSFNNNNKKKNNNNNNKRPLTPESMPPAGEEHAKLNT